MESFSPAPKPSKASFAEWRTWLDAAYEDIVRLHGDRLQWREIVKIVKSNPAIPSPGYFLGWMTRLYITHVSSGIRRQMEQSRDVVTLRRLLESIYSNPTLVMRDEFVNRWCAGDLADEFEVGCANRAFDKWAAGSGSHVARAVIRRDIELLQAAGANIKTYVDERVAHLNKAHADPAELAKLSVPTYQELDDALSMLGELLKKYYNLLTGASLMNAEPTPQYNWQSAFTVPWLPPEDPRADRRTTVG